MMSELITPEWIGIGTPIVAMLAAVIKVALWYAKATHIQITKLHRCLKKLWHWIKWPFRLAKNVWTIARYRSDHQRINRLKDEIEELRKSLAIRDKDIQKLRQEKGHVEVARRHEVMLEWLAENTWGSGVGDKWGEVYAEAKHHKEEGKRFARGE